VRFRSRLLIAWLECFLSWVSRSRQSPDRRRLVVVLVGF
jgi:hypothetical protein